MIVAADESLQLGIDAVIPLSPRHHLVLGWAMTPRGEGTELSIAAGRAGDCPIEHSSFHARPSIHPTDPRQAAVNGFALAFATPVEAPSELVFTLQAGDRTVRADLRDGRIPRDLPAVLAATDWQAAFGLLRDAAATPLLAPLAARADRAYGAFGEWLGRLALVRGRQERLAPFAEVEALSTPSGEVVVMLRATHPVPPDATLEAALIGYYAAADGGLPALVPVPLAEWKAAPLPTAMAAYGRIEAGWLDRLQGLEVVLHARLRAEEETCLRIQPRPGAVPPMLDALARGNRLAALPLDAGSGPALALLRDVIARREAAFLPVLEDLAAQAASAPPADAPRSLLLIGADDPTAARLFYGLAPEIERHCDRLLVMGDAAEAVAQVFARRGRLPVATGAEAVQALRDAAGQDGILAVDVARFATALAAGATVAQALVPALRQADLARLLALHGVAGCGAGLPDSLARLLRLMRATPGELPFPPVPYAMASPAVTDLVNDHLAKLWTAGDAAARARMEGASHA
ncbi:hypothetical protein G3576_27225 [Roseomonas stagni]|uniref:Uncharacterized protein n=1 Tax=Falsiroseomonas algicola TaxID=2716930 RepID=A0A6M1LUQ3_9PROT|nr:hypothetical protein [Falsiroseomonas algicola]NGM23732.1 hypothetical protein [Falsiroseomonas algicola]